ncbi:hypothetical protein CPC08DRAFT_769158 [Agrocybe pediades]|nr:hypothetical protein CPC08DRAFT_769158 [Agrocybe pediades]
MLERVKRWSLRKTENEIYIMWLYGHAGGGKLAIAKKLETLRAGTEILPGEFFSRSDGVARQVSSLGAKVINIRCYPPLAQQMKTLILNPSDIVAPGGIVPRVIVLGGPDETLSSEEQQLVLEVVSRMLYPRNTDFRLLICPRDEPVIGCCIQ